MSTEPKLNKKLADLILKIKTSALEQINAGIQSIQEGQKNLYAQVRQWLVQQSPQTIEKYDASPSWIKTSLLWLPWALLILLTLYYFDVFDSKPKPRYVQDPSVVYVNDDLSKMIKNGQVKTAPFVEELRVSGRIDFNEMYLARIGANVTGRVSDIIGVPGQQVQQGEILAKITSTELTQSQLSYLKARSASQLAEQAANRARILYKEDVIALAELQRREAESSSAKAELRAANDQLRVQGMDQKSIDRLAKTGLIESINNVVATIPGQIVERKINKGQVVQPAEALFTIADLDTLWAVAEVPEGNSSLLQKGQQSTVIIPALRNRPIVGVISHVDAIVNPQTRTVVVRMDVPNQSGQIRPGMLATMLIDSEPVDRLVVPASAIIREDNQDYVFVRDEGERYKMVAVKAGPEGKGMRPILSGVKDGEEIAIEGAFHLNSERKRQLSGG
jgi:cobalt-zinc-cadmium efflux system membrane fusion protein